jgi:hypothetical protein
MFYQYTQCRGTDKWKIGRRREITPGSCPTPFGPCFARSKSLQAILSNSNVQISLPHK